MGVTIDEIVGSVEAAGPAAPAEQQPGAAQQDLQELRAQLARIAKRQDRLRAD